MATLTIIINRACFFRNCKILVNLVVSNNINNRYCPSILLYASYAKKPAVGGALGGSLKGGKAGAVAAPVKKRLEPVTDPLKLTMFLCGGNILKEGSDPELKPKEEYPDWLWNLRLERSAPPFEELENDSWSYWKRLHKEDRKRKMKELSLKYKYHKF